mgnify:CR=1 FL=1
MKLDMYVNSLPWKLEIYLAVFGHGLFKKTEFQVLFFYGLMFCKYKHGYTTTNSISQFTYSFFIHYVLRAWILLWQQTVISFVTGLPHYKKRRCDKVKQSCRYRVVALMSQCLNTICYVVDTLWFCVFFICRDISALMSRHQKYQFDKMLYVVGYSSICHISSLWNSGSWHRKYYVVDNLWTVQCGLSAQTVWGRL